jgi:hypothetical protein
VVRNLKEYSGLFVGLLEEEIVIIAKKYPVEFL